MNPLVPQREGALDPQGAYTPAEYDTHLVHAARGTALHAITVRRRGDDGNVFAWEATVSFAETLLPMAGPDFLRRYRELMLKSAKTGQRPSRALWRLACLEMKRQGRLGGDSVPVERETFGVE